MAGEYFAKHMLNLAQPLNQFVGELQTRLQELKIGVLRIEEADEKPDGSFSPFPKTQTAPVFRFSEKRYATTMKVLSPVFYLFTLENPMRL